MAYESASYIWELNELLPEEANDIGEAQNHLNTLKLTIKNSFPGFSTQYLTINSSHINSIKNLHAYSINPKYNELDGNLVVSKYSSVNKFNALKFGPVETDYVVTPVPCTVSLGTIMQTVLTWDQIKSLYGDKMFIPCDGVSVIPTDSLLGILFTRLKNTKSTNLFDRVITQAKDQADVNHTYGSRTKVTRDIDYIINLIEVNYHNHWGGYHGHIGPYNTWGNPDGGSDNKTIGPDYASQTPLIGYYETNFVNGVTQAFSHSHIINKVNEYSNWTVEKAKNYPNRIVVNNYLRIN